MTASSSVSHTHTRAHPSGVSLSPDGIRLGRGARARLVPWSDVRDYYFRAHDGVAVIEVANGPPVEWSPRVPERRALLDGVRAYTGASPFREASAAGWETRERWPFTITYPAPNRELHKVHMVLCLLGYAFAVGFFAIAALVAWCAPGIEKASALVPLLAAAVVGGVGEYLLRSGRDWAGDFNDRAHQRVTADAEGIAYVDGDATTLRASWSEVERMVVPPRAPTAAAVIELHTARGTFTVSGNGRGYSEFERLLRRRLPDAWATMQNEAEARDDLGEASTHHLRTRALGALAAWIAVSVGLLLGGALHDRVVEGWSVAVALGGAVFLTVTGLTTRVRVDGDGITRETWGLSTRAGWGEVTSVLDEDLGLTVYTTRSHFTLPSYLSRFSQLRRVVRRHAAPL